MFKKHRNGLVIIMAMIAALILSTAAVFAEEPAGQDPVTDPQNQITDPQDQTDPQDIVKADQIIKVDKAKTITIGKTAKLNAVLKEGDGALSYAVSNSKVAKVTDKGVVKAKAVGKATITITAAETEKYAAATCEVTIKVIPKTVPVKSIVCNKHGKFTVKWTSNKKVDGYQVQYCKGNKKFKKSKTKAKKVKKASSKKTVIKKAKKTKYYVRIRTFKKVDGETYYSNWSKAKAIRVK